MSYGVSITVTGAGLSAPARLALALHPERLAPVAGEAGLRCVRNNLRVLSSRTNALGAPSTHFYGRALNATTLDVKGDTATVVIAGPLGIRQRFYGGTIKPTKKKYLTVPIAAEAHGKSAGSFGEGELVVVFGRGRKPIGLARKADGKRQRGAMLYLLKLSVTQRPDPSILPATADVVTEVNRAIEAHVARNFSP